MTKAQQAAKTLRTARQILFHEKRLLYVYIWDKKRAESRQGFPLLCVAAMKNQKGSFFIQ
ncbi:MAG: hypothetical protein IJ822_03080 [Pyramidobacter sp.]|nr:hypothetical protein [Pyramidobacter sp.]